MELRQLGARGAQVRRKDLRALQVSPGLLAPVSVVINCKEAWVVRTPEGVVRGWGRVSSSVQLFDGLVTLLVYITHSWL